MPFRPTFTCLWCGTPATARDPGAVEGWAQLCSACVGRAGDNEFLRFRLRDALAERGRARDAGDTAAPRAGAPGTSAAGAAPAGTAVASRPRSSDVEADTLAYYAARATEYDDWYLRRGRYSHGPIHDAAWHAELDVAGRWLDALPMRGRIVELAAGTGWWSPLLAEKGELWAYDANEAPLELARERLVAHGLRAHLHARDAWAEPDEPSDGLFTGFWLSHVQRGRPDDFLALAHRWLKPGGTFAAIDSMPDPSSGATDHPAPDADRAVRRLDDGRTFTIVKVYYRPEELHAALLRAGFSGVKVASTGRFFLLVEAVA